MKCIMYHYVRPSPIDLPHLHYLHIENFRRQLDWIDANIGFLSREDFERSLEDFDPRTGVVLSFDDAFVDHFDHVLPELQRRGLWGIFYVPTLPYRHRKLLSVHRVHLILGAHGGACAMESLSRHAHNDMLTDREKFGDIPYARQQNEEPLAAFKRAINYYVTPKDRDKLLDGIMTELFGPTFEDRQIDAFYMSPAQIKSLHDADMIVGCHSVNHEVLSKLTLEEQRSEIEQSADDVAAIIGSRVRTFCYPYGKAHTFTQDTEAILSRAGFDFTFSTIEGDIFRQHLKERIQAMPRHDCNAFPFGKSGPV